MVLKLEKIKTPGGSMYDLVLTQGSNVIRLGLLSPDPKECLGELETWLKDNTMDVHEVLRAKTAHEAGISADVLVRYESGTYVAKVKVGKTTYRASCTMGEAHAAMAVAKKVTLARCADRGALGEASANMICVGKKNYRVYTLTLWSDDSVEDA